MVPSYLYFKQITDDFMDNSIGNQHYKGHPNKTSGRVKAGKTLVRYHTWKEEPGKVRDTWILGKIREEEKEAIYSLTQKENGASNEYHLSHWLPVDPVCDCVSYMYLLLSPYHT